MRLLVQSCGPRTHHAVGTALASVIWIGGRTAHRARRFGPPWSAQPRTHDSSTQRGVSSVGFLQWAIMHSGTTQGPRDAWTSDIIHGCGMCWMQRGGTERPKRRNGRSETGSSARRLRRASRLIPPSPFAQPMIWHVSWRVRMWHAPGCSPSFSRVREWSSVSD